MSSFYSTVVCVSLMTKLSYATDYKCINWNLIKHDYLEHFLVKSMETQKQLTRLVIFTIYKISPFFGCSDKEFLDRHFLFIE